MKFHSLRSLVTTAWREPSTLIGLGIGAVVLVFFDADMIREAGERLDALAGTIGKGTAAVTAVLLVLRKETPGDAGSSD